MKLFNKILPFLISATLFASSAADSYRVIEDKAQVPLLNPSLAQRKVKKIELSNGLQAYLISDPDADQAAAGLCVEAGSWQDPKEYAGMAHFLEHMLFMGTAAYPDEAEYMHYISDNGGSVNASTWPDRTIYMFSINKEMFKGALDRFSHFFIDPLFSTSCINRELNAVDNEHSKNIEHDGWRQYMVFKETLNPQHPHSGFSTGNAQTLGGIPQEVMKNWYEKYYTSTRMHLAVIAPLSLEELTEVVVDCFSRVPRRNTSPLPSLPAEMTTAEQRGHMIYLKPVKDLRCLSLIWEIPSPFSQDIEKQAPQFVAYVLNDQREKTLIADLKKERWIEGLKASCERSSKNKLLFSVDIDLTDLGLLHTDEILARFFQTVSQFKTGIPSYLFDEMKKMATLNYQYQAREDAFRFISTHAHDLLDEDLSTYPQKSAIPTTYDKAYVTAFVKTLTPEKGIYFLIADPEKSGISPDKKEKWMAAEYAIKPLPSEKLIAWQESSLSPKTVFPASNPYIPDHLALLPVKEGKKEETVVPSLLADEEWGKVYYAQDKKYLLPEVAHFIQIKTPLLDGSARSTALADLYLKSLVEKLSGTLSSAARGGLSPSFGLNKLKLCMSVTGFSEKAPLLLREIASSLKMVEPSREDFYIFKQSLLSDYDNGSKELPFRQASALLDSIIYNDAPTAQEKQRALKEISYEEFLSFSKNLFKSCYVEALFYGNLSSKEALQVGEKIRTSLAPEKYFKAAEVQKQVLLLPEKRGPYVVAQTTPRQGNGVVFLLQQGPFSFEKRAAQQILGKALQEAFWDTLRTKQQTGYIAKAWDLEVERQLLQCFAVQSNSHHPSELVARIDLFLEDFNRYMPEAFSKERFEEMRRMLVFSLEMPPENLEGMGARLNNLAFNYGGDFRWIEKRTEAMRTLSYETVCAYAHEFFSRSNLRRLAVLMEGVLPKEKEFHYEVVSKEDVRDLGHYISSN